MKSFRLIKLQGQCSANPTFSTHDYRSDISSQPHPLALPMADQCADSGVALPCPCRLQHQACQPSARHTARYQVVNTAYKMIGTPYRYGGSSPNGFDCSGLVLFTYQQAGFEVPRTAFDQYLRSTPVSSNSMEPGDLLFFTQKSRTISMLAFT